MLTNLISTHTPLAGRDLEGRVDYMILAVFQLTRPLRGVTYEIERLDL